MYNSQFIKFLPYLQSLFHRIIHTQLNLLLKILHFISPRILLYQNPPSSLPIPPNSISQPSIQTFNLHHITPMSHFTLDFKLFPPTLFSHLIFPLILFHHLLLHYLLFSLLLTPLPIFKCLLLFLPLLSQTPLNFLMA